MFDRTCLLCGDDFRTVRGCNIHTQYCHRKLLENVSAYMCECGFCCNTELALRNHLLQRRRGCVEIEREELEIAEEEEEDGMVIDVGGEEEEKNAGEQQPFFPNYPPIDPDSINCRYYSKDDEEGDLSCPDSDGESQEAAAAPMVYPIDRAEIRFNALATKW